MRLLFLCGRNRRRSPTAEQLFGGLAGLEVVSAGLNTDAECQVDADMIQWADVIFVMEESHRRRLSRMFGNSLAQKRIVCLGIADDYPRDDPELVRLLWQAVSRHVPAVAEAKKHLDGNERMTSDDVPAAWPFDQPPNCAVITVRRIVFDGAPILYVFHDEDENGWQFMDGEAFETADGAVVCLKEIVALDPSVLQVAHIPPAWMAWRTSAAEPWETGPQS